MTPELAVVCVVGIIGMVAMVALAVVFGRNFRFSTSKESTLMSVGGDKPNNK